MIRLTESSSKGPKSYSVGGLPWAGHDLEASVGWRQGQKQGLDLVMETFPGCPPVTRPHFFPFAPGVLLLCLLFG